MIYSLFNQYFHVGNIKRNTTDEELRHLKEIGELIKKRRKKLGLTQYQLAHDADVADNTIGQIERAEISISLITLLRVCKILDLELNIQAIKE